MLNGIQRYGEYLAEAIKSSNIINDYSSWWLTLFQIFQLETVGVYLRSCREFANGAATHGAKPWVFGDQLHAAESEQRPSYDGSPRVLFGADETSGHLS